MANFYSAQRNRLWLNGQTIIGTGWHNYGELRTIDSLSGVAYEWHYPEHPEQKFWTGRTCDPDLRDCWEDYREDNLLHVNSVKHRRHERMAEVLAGTCGE